MLPEMDALDRPYLTLLTLGILIVNNFHRYILKSEANSLETKTAKQRNLWR